MWCQDPVDESSQVDGMAWSGAAATDGLNRADESPRSGLSSYMRAISRIPLLTKQQERDLARRIRQGDLRAKEKMILANLRLVVAIARRYQGLGLPLADLISEGNIGLMKAVERFRYEKGFRFSTYASKWIRQAITKTLANQGRTVRLPANVLEMLRRARDVDDQSLRTSGAEASECEICERLKVSRKRYAQVANASITFSLDSPCSFDSEFNLHDVLPDRDHKPPDEDAFSRIDANTLACLLEHLSKRERSILSYRFGLEDGTMRSLAETGKIVGITRERIRQIEKRAIQKMRRLLRKRRLQKTMLQR